MSPFDVEPPRWLQQIAKPIDGQALGHVLGMSLMSLATSLERDPNAPDDASFLESRKGINEGFYETQMNERDPQWRVKGQLLANQVLQQKAQLAATGAMAEEQRKESSAWMEDAPNLTPWITATPEQRRTMVAPTAKSKLGLTTLQKQSVADQTYFTRQDQMDNRLEQERLKAEHSAGITVKVSEFNDALGAASPDTYSQISAIKGGGRLPNGLPTPEAIALLNVDRRARGMTDYGTKASEYLTKPNSEEDSIRKDRLRELNSQETQLIRDISKAQTPEEKASLKTELRALQATRKAVREGREPTDQVANDTDNADADLKHQANVARVHGDKSAVAKVEQTMRDERKVAALDKGAIDLPPQTNRKEFLKSIAGLRAGTLVWDDTRAQSYPISQKTIDAANMTLAFEQAKEDAKVAGAQKYQSEVQRATIPEGQRSMGLP